MLKPNCRGEILPSPKHRLSLEGVVERAQGESRRQEASPSGPGTDTDQPGCTAKRPPVPRSWGREVAFVGLGSAPLGECSGAGVRDSEDVGSLAALEALSSRGSHRSRAHSGHGRAWGAQRRRGGPAGEVLGAPSGHSRAPKTGVWGRGLETQSLGGDGGRPGVPRRLTFLAFLPPTGAISLVSGGAGHGCGQAKRAFPARSRELPGGRSQALYTHCSPRGAFPQPPPRASGGEHAHQLFIEV